MRAETQSADSRTLHHCWFRVRHIPTHCAYISTQNSAVLRRRPRRVLQTSPLAPTFGPASLCVETTRLCASRHTRVASMHAKTSYPITLCSPKTPHRPPIQDAQNDLRNPPRKGSDNRHKSEEEAPARYAKWSLNAVCVQRITPTPYAHATPRFCIKQNPSKNLVYAFARRASLPNNNS